jgi:hypothetical protein
MNEWAKIIQDFSKKGPLSINAQKNIKKGVLTVFWAFILRGPLFLISNFKFQISSWDLNEI